MWYIIFLILLTNSIKVANAKQACTSFNDCDYTACKAPIDNAGYNEYGCSNIVNGAKSWNKNYGGFWEYGIFSFYSPYNTVNYCVQLVNSVSYLCHYPSCPAGKYIDNWQPATVPLNFNSNSPACSPCLKGSYCLGTWGNPTAILCPKGKYSAITGLSACIICNAGTYASQVGASTCTSCESGKFLFFCYVSYS